MEGIGAIYVLGGSSVPTVYVLGGSTVTVIFILLIVSLYSKLNISAMNFECTLLTVSGSRYANKMIRE